MTELILSTPSLLITLDRSLSTSDLSDYQQPRVNIPSLFIQLFFYLFVNLLVYFTLVNCLFANLWTVKYLFEYTVIYTENTPLWVVSVRGCDSSKVAKWLCWDRASTWLFSCEFTSCMQSIFLGEHLWRTASEHR